MRKMLFLSIVGLTTLAGSGCCCMFGAKRTQQSMYQNYQPLGGECCDPCATGGTMMAQPMMMAAPAAAPCCSP